MFIVCYRRSHRAVMIEQGLVEWLADMLGDGCDHAYTLEYGTALLMNLCLHEEARDRCSTNIIKVLMDLLDVQQNQVMQILPFNRINNMTFTPSTDIFYSAYIYINFVQKF